MRLIVVFVASVELAAIPPPFAVRVPSTTNVEVLVPIVVVAPEGARVRLPKVNRFAVVIAPTPVFSMF